MTLELRKDYILNRWVIIAEKRAERPREFVESEPDYKPGECAFCPGNEHMCPEEKGRKGEPWHIRWFENKFKAVDYKGSPELKTDNTFFTYSDAFGVHEIIVETNNHNENLWDFDKQRLKELLQVYNERIEEIDAMPNIEYVSVFKNHGKKAGASIVHSHSQVIALNVVPSYVRDCFEAATMYGACPYCRIWQIEKDSLRRCFENSSFIAFTPYASRFNYEIWILPKKHYIRLRQINDKEYDDLAEILQKILRKLKSINAPFNLEFIHSPYGRDLHFRFEITPRISTWAGFEFGSGVTINSVSPEKAAEFYRE